MVRFIQHYIESLLDEYRKTNAKLKKEQDKLKEKESLLYEQEVEIKNLTKFQDSQHSIVTQFENDYADLKKRNSLLLEDLKSLRSENTHLKKSEQAMVKEKQEKE